jgi:Domain of unknown function (DUF1707)
MAGPGDDRAAPTAGSGHFRASQADREQAIEVLKTAFVADRLTKDEFDLRVGRALASRTHAELAAVTSDLHAWPAATGPAAAGLPSTPARTLAKAARRSGICMLAAFAIVGVIGLTKSESQAALALALFAVVAAAIAASGFLGYGVVDAWQEHRSRGQLPPRPGRNGGGPEVGRSGTTGGYPALPRDRPDQTRADLRTDRSRPGRPHPSGRGSRAPQGIRPTPSVA